MAGSPGPARQPVGERGGTMVWLLLAPLLVLVAAVAALGGLAWLQQSPVFFRIIARQMLRATVEVVPRRAIQPAWLPAVEHLEAMGFTLAAVVRVHVPVLPDDWRVLLVDEERRCYGRVSGMTGAGTPLVAFVSEIDGGLLSTAMVGQGPLVTELTQSYPGGDPAMMLARHVEAQRFLEANGVAVRPPAADRAVATFEANLYEEVLCIRSMSSSELRALHAQMDGGDLAGVALADQPGIVTRLADFRDRAA